MGINEILGRMFSKDDGEYYNCILGECTQDARDVLDGRRDVHLHQRFQSKARFMQCPECDLIDCVFREDANESFPEGGKCPRCGATQERMME